jgi:hypothetical protein
MAKKEADLGPRCYTFETYGRYHGHFPFSSRVSLSVTELSVDFGCCRCMQGYGCRFGDSHINRETGAMISNPKPVCLLLFSFMTSQCP